MSQLGKQIAALPLQWDRKKQVRVLMVTSRDTGRWVLPKGWLMEATTPWAAAEIEALEEAGAIGYIASETIGFYHYDKILDNGGSLRCRVEVYPMLIEKLKRNWKERRERRRRWFTPKGAAKRVNEEELSDMLRMLSYKPHKQPVVGTLLR